MAILAVLAVQQAGSRKVLPPFQEINMDRRGARKRAEALEAASAALVTFQDTLRSYGCGTECRAVMAGVCLVNVSRE